MRKIVVVLGLTLASMSFASVAKDNDNNSRGDVTVVGNRTSSVHISQCASTWNCNNSELNVEFTGDVGNVTINGEHTVIKGQDGKNGKDGIDGKDGLRVRKSGFSSKEEAADWVISCRQKLHGEFFSV